MSHIVIDQMDMPDLGDEADAPIILPKPGQILRRSARTKIRKPGQTGEGAHRFQTRSRRVSGPRTSPGSPYSDQEPSLQDFDPRILLDERPAPVIGTARPESFSDETFIYDAYAMDDPAEVIPVLVSQPPPVERSPSPPSIIEFEPQRHHTIQPHNIPIPLTPPLHHPQPRHHLTPTTEPQPPSRTPSPDASSVTLVEAPHRASESHHHPVPTPPPPPSQDRKEKDKSKKGGLFGWGGEKGKKGSKEKDNSFLGSLFGGSKKKQEEYTGTGLGTGAGRETAAALLGASKSKSRAPSPTPQPGGPYARYPIHVERAIYRLSHIKLANPRRPLYEQVLISNLMFWYLGVINNKGQTNGASQNQNQTKESQPQQGAGQQTQGGGRDTNPNLEKERREQEEREREERERIEVEKEREREREREKEFLTQQQQQQAQKREPKRGPLTKPAPGPPGQRRAEMPVRGPQYEMQQRMMDQEYGGYDPRNQLQSRPGPVSPYNTGSQPIQPQLQMTSGVYYNPGNPPGPNSPSQGPPSPQLPPGAMSPMNEQVPWNNQVRVLFYPLSYASLWIFPRRVVRGGPDHHPKIRTAKIP